MKLGIVDSARVDVFGGTETALIDLARHARRGGHGVSVVGRPGSAVVLRAREAGLPAGEVSLRNSLDLPSILALRTWLHANAVQVVVAALHRDVRMLGLARLAARTPRIVMVHGLPLIKDNIRHALTYRWFVDGILAPTEWLREIIRRYPFTEKIRVEVAPDGIDEKLFPACEQLVAARGAARAGTPPGRAIFFSAGRLVARKNFRFLIPELAALPKELDWEWWIAGDGAERHSLKAAAERAGIGGRTRFLGERRDITALLLQVDALLVPSLSEQLPLVVLEAIRAGVPSVLVSPAGAAREMEDLGATVVPLEGTKSWTMAMAAASVLAGRTRVPPPWSRSLEQVQDRRVAILESMSGFGSKGT